MPAYDVKWFKHDMPGAPVLTGEPGMLIGLLDACLLNGWGLVSVDSLTFDSNTGEATLTVTGGHGFIVDQVILISGANEAEFNGEQRVTWIDSTTVKFNPVHIPQVATASGSITAKVAPQGSWGKPFSSGDNLKAIYQSSSPDRLSSAGLRVDDSNTATGWNGYGANSIIESVGLFTDLDTTSEQFEALNYKLIKKSDAANNTIREWCLIADQRLIYLFINHQAASGLPMAAYTWGEVISYKDQDAHAVLSLIGSNTSTGYSPTSFGLLGSNLGSSIQRAYDGVSLSESIELIGVEVGYNFMGGFNANPYPCPIDNSVALTDRVFIREPVGFRGEMPGLGYPLHRTPLPHLSFQIVPWRSSSAKIKVISIKKAPQSSHDGQLFIDIEGPWRA